MKTARRDYFPCSYSRAPLALSQLLRWRYILAYPIKNCQENSGCPLFILKSILGWMINYTFSLSVAELLSSLTFINMKGNPLKALEILSRYKQCNHKDFTVSHFIVEDQGHREIKMRSLKPHFFRLEGFNTTTNTVYRVSISGGQVPFLQGKYIFLSEVVLLLFSPFHRWEKSFEKLITLPKVIRWLNGETGNVNQGLLDSKLVS